MRILSLVILALAVSGCALSSRYEHLHVASGTRTFWHNQPGDLKVGLGFRERDGKPTEVIVLVRNDGVLPATVPVLQASSVSLYIDGERAAVPEGEGAGKWKTMALEPGASQTFIYPVEFKKGRAYRVFGAVGPLKQEDARSRIVTPEVAVSAVFGPPLRYHFRRWASR